MSKADTEKLATIGLLGAVAWIIGLNLSSSLWVIPAVAVNITGTSAVTSMLIVVIPVLLILPAYFVLVRSEPTNLGHFKYPARYLSDNTHLNQFLTTAGTFSFFATVSMFALPLAAITAGDFLNTVHSPIPPITYAVAVLALAYVTNALGVRIVGMVEIFFITLLFVAVLLLTVGGVQHMEPANFAEFFAGDTATYIATWPLVFTLAGGALFAIDLGSDIRDGSRNVPIVLVLGILGVMILSAMITLVVAGTIPHDELAGETVAYVASQILSGPAFVFTAIFGALFASFSTLVAAMTLTGRYLAEPSQFNVYPKSLATENRFGEPMYALTISFVIAIVFLFLGLPFQMLIAGFTFSFLFLYSLVTISGIRYVKRYSDQVERNGANRSFFTSPKAVTWGGFIALPIYAVFFVFLALENPVAFGAWFATLLIGGVYYLVRSRMTGEMPAAVDFA
ncbi:APC family permease [Natrarchaeobius halalkaliphilus]|uniref:APC family permease n=1 Tax=Natrarchaeobius halalkaliphilus TaxID=1679091 RepID=A0A3N6LJ44_9EURY|nr:APC family permease [Natrarchaeobius halalkaliphilus]RQG87871.1 APC family permease [Natrarchaeobius halalkaliphilus]